jgi:hypothetical protein
VSRRVFSDNWHEETVAKLGLRAAGLVLLAFAYWAGTALFHRFAGSLVHPPLEYLLALVTFVCASVGSAMTIMGHHLFDQVEVSSRWVRLPPPTESLRQTGLESAEQPHRPDRDSGAA